MGWFLEQPIDPLDSNSIMKGGSWVRLEEGSDYEVDPLLGYIRFKSLSSQDVIGVSYEIGSFDGQQINQLPNNPFPNNIIFMMTIFKICKPIVMLK